MMLFGSPGLAVAQFAGSHRTTQSCLNAVSRLLASSVQIRRALLLTADGRHGFYLDIGDPEPIFVRGGFTSGYGGEGPAGLAIALQLFKRFEVDVEEVIVAPELLTRIDENRPTSADLDFVLKSPMVRPIRIYDYQHDGLQGRGSAEARMREQFLPSVSWSLIDERLIDLALVLRSDPDKAVFQAFRRLESTVVDRARLPPGTVGKEVFRRAFRGSGAALSWLGVPAAEVEGRAQLFEAAFLAYRNPRAHREEELDVSRAYREFYLVNELFWLERQAVWISKAEGALPVQ